MIIEEHLYEARENRAKEEYHVLRAMEEAYQSRLAKLNFSTEGIPSKHVKQIITGEICVECRKVYIIDIRPEAFKAWRNGMLIQNAMPELTPEELEILITGICNECFHAIFQEEG